MGWAIVFIIIAVVVAVGVGGAVLHPVLYGLFIAGALIIPCVLISLVVNGVINSLFGKRR